MKDKTKLCERCLIRGYSPDLCREHYKMLAKMNHEFSLPKIPLKTVGKTAAVGAGFGVATTLAIITLPVVAVKTTIGLLIVAKISAGGGVVGAGINMAKKARKNKPNNEPKRKRRILIL